MRPPLNVAVRKTNQAGIDLIKEVEGIKLKAYLDTGNVPTIGYGHTKGVKIGDTCTPEQAEEWLKNDLSDAEKGVFNMVKVPLTDNQFSALVSFVYNLGATTFRKSSVLAYLNNGQYDKVPERMMLYVWDNGKVIKGLRIRREKECALFRKTE